jgi:heptosyltransferase-2
VIRYDCRHYVGKKPCRHKRVCDGCPHHDPVGERILVIKLGALGDLLRTTAVLKELKHAYPRSHVTWLTLAEGVPLLANLPEIDRLWVTDSSAGLRVQAEQFDLLFSFDKETPAVELATLARAKVKRGFALSDRGALIALNEGSEYALRMGVDDELKFRRNTQTYQRMILDMAELPQPARPPMYRFDLTEPERAEGRELMKRGAGKVVVGLNPGASRIFATKKWHPERFAEAAIRLHKEYGVVPALLGGRDESELLDQLERALRKAKVPLVRPGEDLGLRQFAAAVGQCQGIITGDTLAMHLALAQEVRTLVLFTSTCHQEIELADLGRAIVGRASCAPCYRSTCNQPSQYCSDSISVDAVVTGMAELLELKGVEKVRRRSHV